MVLISVSNKTMELSTWDIVKGCFATAVAGTGIAISLTDVEQWLRIATLAAALVVSLLTSRSLCRKNWPKKTKPKRKD